MQLLQHQHLDFLQLFLSPHLDKVLYLTVLSLAVMNDYNASHIENIVLWGQKVLMVSRIQLGTGGGNKMDECSEKFQNFQSKNFYCRFWTIKTGLFEHEFEKKNVI